MSSSTASRGGSAAAIVLALAGCPPMQPAGITASGVFEAIEVNVGVKVPGQLKTVAVEEGREVKAGGLVAEIDCSDLDFQVTQARANLALAASQHQLAAKGARDEDIRHVAAGDSLAQAGHTLAQTDFERVQKLFKEGAVTQKMIEDAATRLKAATVQKEQAAEALKKVKRFTRSEEIAMAGARVDAARAAVDALEKKVGDCRVVSPVSGLVLRKVFEAGEMVGPASTIAVVSDLRRLRAVVYLPEPDMSKIRLGDRVAIAIDGSSRRFEGTVSHISQRAEFTPKNVQTRDERVKQMFAVKLMVENPDLALKPGMPMDVDFGPR
ncbi:MAG: efflux RND transporter periplasmic adaptor subunit [Deltaproteobacteria bacterium]|nr:efflux RND transporter periplasmic adaptor subunit [Deltaproteobacteria bacterium]